MRAAMVLLLPVFSDEHALQVVASDGVRMPVAQEETAPSSQTAMAVAPVLAVVSSTLEAL